MTNIETLIENVRQWGVDKGITGLNGKGTIEGQIKKSSEEFTETLIAASQFHLISRIRSEIRDPYFARDIAAEIGAKVIDGIGDATVTLILLAELSGVDFEYCLQTAYDEIKGRTGQMLEGVFVKDATMGTTPHP